MTAASNIITEVVEVCREVFTKRPCLGIWHSSSNLNDDALSRLTFTDFPVSRYKAMDCEEWVDGDGIANHYPAMCVKCREVLAPAKDTRGSSRKRKPNPKYEEEEEEKVVEVKQELPLTTTELELPDFNSIKQDSEGGEEYDHFDDAAGVGTKQDEVCEDAFDGFEEEFIPDSEAGEVPPEPQIEMLEGGGGNVDGR